jgi:hypothetical protein
MSEEELNIDFSEPSEADLEEEAGFSGEELKEGEEDSPQAIAEKRGQEILDDLEKEEEGRRRPPEPTEKAPPPVRRQEPPPQDKPQRMTKEAVARLLKSIDLDELPEGEVIIGDTAVNLRELAEYDPEEFAAKVVLSGAIAEKTIGSLLRSGQLATRSQIEGILDAVGERLDGQAYWLEMLQVHPDALDIKASKDFKDWINKQDKGMRLLAASGEPRDGIKLVDYYKEATGKAKRKTTAAPSRKRRTRSADKDVDLDDEQAGWDLGGKKFEGWS